MGGCPDASPQNCKTGNSPIEVRSASCGSQPNCGDETRPTYERTAPSRGTTLMATLWQVQPSRSIPRSRISSSLPGPGPARTVFQVTDGPQSTILRPFKTDTDAFPSSHYSLAFPSGCLHHLPQIASTRASRGAAPVASLPDTSPTFCTRPLGQPTKILSQDTIHARGGEGRRCGPGLI